MKYDFAVVGSGPAGYTFAIRAAQLKKRCIVFEESFPGGTCLNVGCIPSKVWRHIADFYKSIKTETPAFGIKVQEVTVDWSKLQEFKNSVIERLRNGIKSLFKAHRVEYINKHVEKIKDGKVYFKSDNRENFIESQNIILAVGGTPIHLKEFDYKNPNVLTYKNCFDLEKLPSSIIIVGGGIIGIELATIFANFGVKVYVVELLDTILSGIDKEVVSRLVRKLKELNVGILTSSSVEKVNYSDSNVEVIVKNKKVNQITTFSGDKVIVAVGIMPPDTNQIVSCELTEKGWVKVNENFETSVKGLYAIGDIIGPPFLAHRAYYQAKVLAGHLIKNLPARQTSFIPTVVYTEPEIAYVGLQEEELKNQKIEYKVSKFYYTSSGRAVADNKTDGFIKVFSTPDRNEILGAIIVGTAAGELIGEYTLALEAKLSLENVATTIHPHPTYSEIVPESAENALGYSIHILPPNI
ncbi:MAG: dihydrolipoyl dehydrogenase [Planctomycetota bacterium]